MYVCVTFSLMPICEPPIFLCFFVWGGGGEGVFVPLIGHVCDIFVVVYF